MQFNESHIIFRDGGLFDADIMFKTKGQGVNVIINYSAGIKNLISAINCGSYFAFYVETVHSNFNEHYEIGNIFSDILKKYIISKYVQWNFDNFNADKSYFL